METKNRGSVSGIFKLGALGAWLFSVALFLTPSITHAAAPNTIPFQGKVVNSSGTNVTDGTYSFTFKLYDESSVQRWGEIQANVQVTSGIFQVNLGTTCGLFAGGTCSGFSNNILDFNANTYSLGIAFNGDSEMTPRITMGSVPYAFNAQRVGGLTVSQLIQLSPAAPQSGNISLTGSATFQGSNALTLGSTSNAGAVLLKDGTANDRTVTLNVTGVTASYVLTLPTSAPATNRCIISGSTVASQLQFGSCGGAVTMQDSYDSSGTTNPQIALNATNGGFEIRDAASTVGSLFTVANSGGGTKYLDITNAGASINGVLSVSSGTSVPATDQVSISNTASTGVTTAGVNGLQVDYKGGAAAVESAGIRVDFTPGGTTGGTWSGMRIVANATGAASGVTQYGIRLDGPSSPGAGSESGMYIGTGWDIGLDVQSGGLQLAEQTDPSAPAANNLRIYAKNVAGRMMPKWIGPSGVDTPFQASFGFNRIAMMTPSGLGTAAATTVMNTWGANYTNSASTYTNPALASSSTLASVRRARLTPATNNTSAIAYHSPTQLMVWRGNASGQGGFFFTIRFSYSALLANSRSFVGMVDSTTAPTSVNPLTNTTPGRFGIATTSNTGNLQWINNISGTAPTTTDLGANFPVNTTDLYELIVYSPPNGSGITYRIQNMSTGNVSANTSVTTNIPSNTTFLAPQYWIAAGGTSGTMGIESAGWYLESDN